MDCLLNDLVAVVEYSCVIEPAAGHWRWRTTACSLTYTLLPETDVNINNDHVLGEEIRPRIYLDPSISKYCCDLPGINYVCDTSNFYIRMSPITVIYFAITSKVTSSVSSV